MPNWQFLQIYCILKVSAYNKTAAARHTNVTIKWGKNDRRLLFSLPADTAEEEQKWLLRLWGPVQGVETNIFCVLNIKNTYNTVSVSTVCISTATFVIFLQKSVSVDSSPPLPLPFYSHIVTIFVNGVYVGDGIQY